MNNYYEIVVCIYLKENIWQNNVQEEISKFLNKALCKSEYLKNIHTNKRIKGYSFSSIYPQEKDLIYKKDSIYNFKLRTWDNKFAKELSENLYGFENDKIIVVGLSNKQYKLNEKIEILYTLNPAIITIKENNSVRSWEKKDNIELLKTIIFNNLKMKFNNLYNVEYALNSEEVFKEIKVIRQLKTRYKNVNLISYNLKLEFLDTVNAQILAKIAYVNGVGSRNSSVGAGFIHDIRKEIEDDA
ncbi:TPA: hypothetical protein I9080_002092 [Clostridium perfringens]|uniref:Uncharacterized protein n=2 Tax=Clostridium perfringens TaxID=1502 RepID=A0A8H9UXB0_CLOPF|nr:CRISPR-associated endoribonuclease Cas6 [Clostridium perfringens]EDT15869.1 conserved hypothetical protein [Clostridium perfringens E str. JGS1987]MCX0407817.1 CRISPR-associated endoribonuclease Cas6 [Clostridium perfringens]HAT4308282.1 hypothetical protein [Clostridium perfringens]